MRLLRSWGVVAVFVVADVAVLGLAWRQTHQPPVTADAAVTTPSATGTTATSSSQISGPLFLATSADGAVLRVTRGSCDARQPEQARVWVAPGSGRRLSSVRVSGLQEALGVLATDNALRIVGADSSCRAHGWISTDAGRTWKQGPVPSRMWYLDTDTTKSVVHGPVTGGVQNIDCTPVSVLTLPGGSQALVSCSGSNLIAVPDDPRTATVSYAVSTPVAAAQPDGGLPFVLAVGDSCTAELDRVVSQQEATQVACLSQSSAPLGLAVSGQRLLVQVGQRLLLSTDGGSHFGAYPS